MISDCDKGARPEADQVTDEAAAQDLVEVAHAWDRAMTTNDAAAIGRFMADDWIIVGSDGSVTEGRPSWAWLNRESCPTTS